MAQPKSAPLDWIDNHYREIIMPTSLVMADIFGFGALFGLIGLLIFAFWIWMLIDCLINPRLVGAEKIVWVIVILFLHVLGALIYYFVAKSKQT